MMELERETGIEPATNGLGSRDSTTELLPLNRYLQNPSPKKRAQDFGSGLPVAKGATSRPLAPQVTPA